MAGIKGQKHNPYIEGRYAHINKNDVVFTPDWLAKKICSMFEIGGFVLEPCKGEGVFLQYLPKNTEWCEIADGKNFYDYTKKVHWIVTNPPYSDFDRFLDHSFELADNVVLLVPIAKIMKSMGTLKKVFQYGGIVSCHFLGGGQAGFPFGFPVGVYHLQKNYKGLTRFDLLDNRIANPYLGGEHKGKHWRCKNASKNGECCICVPHDECALFEMQGMVSDVPNPPACLVP